MGVVGAIVGWLYGGVYVALVAGFCVFNTLLAGLGRLRWTFLPRILPGGNRTSVDELRPSGTVGEWSISVVIPCFNEEHSIATVLGTCVQGAQRPDLLDFIVVQCAGTTDRTLEVAEEAGKAHGARVSLLHS
eukprot:Hpha_TRINITY_DN26202_c0_g1::TRINITY_DN26202_c0_g1_i1::g.184625::m.184625